MKPATNNKKENWATTTVSRHKSVYALYMLSVAMVASNVTKSKFLHDTDVGPVTDSRLDVPKVDFTWACIQTFVVPLVPLYGVRMYGGRVPVWTKLGPINTTSNFFSFKN